MFADDWVDAIFRAIVANWAMSEGVGDALSSAVETLRARRAFRLVPLVLVFALWARLQGQLPLIDRVGEGAWWGWPLLFDRRCCKAVIAVIAVVIRCRESLARAPVSRKALNTIKDGLLALGWVVVAALAVLGPGRALLAIATCWADCLPRGVRSGCAVVSAIVTGVAHASW